VTDANCTKPRKRAHRAREQKLLATRWNCLRGPPTLAWAEQGSFYDFAAVALGLTAVASRLVR